MKKITNLFKTLLVAAVLCVGSTSAWGEAGDVTTNVDIDFSNTLVTSGSSPKYSVAGTKGSMIWDNQWTVTPYISEGRLCFGNFTGSVALQDQNIRPKDIVTISFEMAYGKLTGKHVGFVLKNTSGTAFLTQYFDAYNGDFDDNNPLNLDWTYMYRGSNTVLVDRCVYFTITLNYETGVITTATKCYLSGTDKSRTDHEFTSSFTSSNVLGSFELTGNTNNAGRYSTFDNLKITTTEGNYNTSRTITYVYKDNNGNDITDLVVAKGGTASATPEVNDTYTPVYLSSFIDDEWAYDYTYTSGGDSFTVTDNETITIVYTKSAHATTDVTVQYKNGDDVLKEDVVAEDYPVGKSITYNVRKYILSGGTLYQSTAGTSRTVAAAATIEESLSSSGIGNVVFFSEGEECSNKTGTSTLSVASRQQMGRFAGDCNICTLEKGIYQINAMIHVGNGSDTSADFGTATFTAGGFTGTKTVKQRTNNQSYTSDNFLLESNTDVTLNFGGSNASGVDYIYIVKTGECYESMSIVGDFSENAWDETAGIEMTRDAENPHVWTAVVKDFVVTSSKYNYEYKATANGTWGVYELGEDDNSSNNQTYNFDYDGAREGKYTLTFTVNTSTNRVSLAIEKQHTYTVVGCYNNDETPSFFGTAWAPTLEDNDMTDNGDGTYTKTFNNVTLEVGTIWYKVVEDHAWTNSWGFDPSKNGGNADYYVGTAGTYHITFTFNPNADGYKVSCSLIPATVTKNITTAGWATYCSPYALDFTNAIANLEAAYIVTGGADGVLEMTEVTGIVPANTGLLLKGEGDVAIPVASSDANVDVSANKLEGVTANTVIDAETGYVLMASPSLGFYLNSNAFTVGANTAYLPADFDVTSARFFLLDGGKTTSISEQFLDEPSGKAERTVNSEKLVYDLQGRRVNSSLKPGLYIMSGKKVVIK